VVHYGAKYIYDGVITECLPVMAEGGRVRISIGFPEEIYQKLEEIAKRQHRPIGSVILEACDHFLNERETREAVLVAEQSSEYKVLIKRLREDLGLPPDSLHSPERRDPD
jgi:predicted DNA-binding protein